MLVIPIVCVVVEKEAFVRWKRRRLTPQKLLLDPMYFLQNFVFLSWIP